MAPKLGFLLTTPTVYVLVVVGLLVFQSNKFAVGQPRCQAWMSEGTTRKKVLKNLPWNVFCVVIILLNRARVREQRNLLREWDTRGTGMQYST